MGGARAALRVLLTSARAADGHGVASCSNLLCVLEVFFFSPPALCLLSFFVSQSCSPVLLSSSVLLSRCNSCRLGLCDSSGYRRNCEVRFRRPQRHFGGIDRSTSSPSAIYGSGSHPRDGCSLRNKEAVCK